jgi:uncharacterized protein (TIGR02284 family)
VGAVHVAWMDALALITGGERRAVLNACARGESAAGREYEAALRHNLPDDIDEILRSQHAAILKAERELARLLVAS